MATTTDVIHRALRIVGVVAAEETPTSAEVNSALDVLNQMIASWQLDGIRLGWDALKLTDELNVPADHIRGFAYNLAIDLAPEYGVSVSQATQGIAESAKQAISRAYARPPTLRVDFTLSRRYVR